jgi:hypothetical protein
MEIKDMKPAGPVFVSLVMTRAVMAGSSANYTLAPDTVDHGGSRGASPHYTLDRSTAAGTAGSSASYTARTGFAGQLFEVIAIDISASPLTVSEGDSRQLGATLLFDDSTAGVLAAGSVSWSVQSGPLAGINASGLATAAAVHQDTAAVARGAWQTFAGTLSLTVLNTQPDNFQSYAGDGLPDDWQVLYFGVGHPFAGPFFDPDGDGQNNLFEYNACLVPIDPASVFSISLAEVAGGGHKIIFSPRLPECSYALRGSSDLTDWTPVAGTVTDAGTTRTIVDPAGAERRRFYYISIERQ